MGRISTKENKTVYQISREALGYSREKASEVLGWISPERIEKIENEKSTPRSDEVLEMSIGAIRTPIFVTITAPRNVR